MAKCKLLLPVLLLLSSVLVLFSPVLFTGKTFFLRDITYLFHPWKSLCTEMLISGQMPLWNHYAHSGMPLLANWQTAVFYPFSILFYLFPFSLALKYFQATHLFLAGLFAYLFIRSRGLSRWPALSTAALFALNGYMITRLEFLSHIGVDAWFFALLLLSGEPLLLAIALSISFMAGHQMFFVSAVLLLFYSLIDRRPSFAVTVRDLFLTVLLTCGVVACQLFPTAELALLSARISSGLDTATALANSIRLRDLPGIITPYLNIPGNLLIAGEKFPWAATFYLGFAGTFLAVIGLAVGLKERTALFATVLAVIGILLSLGSATPVYPWLYKVTFLFRLIRYPVQFMFLTVAGLSILAAYGVEKVHFKHLAAIVVMGELLLIGINFQATADASFFTAEPASVAFLQSASDERFILSPGTETERRFKGNDIIGAWQEARGFLFGMTCLPYHLSNAYGTGEPLTTGAVEAQIDRAYRANNAQAALPWFASLGAKYLICRNRLSDPAGYSLLSKGPPFIYRIDSPDSSYVTGNTTVSHGPVTKGQGRIRFSASSAIPSSLVVRETFYPGWETFVNDKQVFAQKEANIFRRVAIPAGEARINMIYRPVTVMIGAAVSVLFFCLIALFGVRSLSSRRSPDRGIFERP